MTGNDVSFSLQLELEEVSTALESLDQQDTPDIQRADRLTALLEWKRRLEAQLKRIDVQIAAELSSQAKKSHQASHRDHELAVELSKRIAQARDQYENDRLVAVELSKESEETQAIILQKIEGKVDRERGRAGVPRALNENVAGVRQAPQPPGVCRATQNRQVPPVPQDTGAPEAPQLPQAQPGPQVAQAPRESLAVVNKREVNQFGKREAAVEPSGRPETQLRVNSAFLDPLALQTPQAQRAVVKKQEINQFGKREAPIEPSGRPEKQPRVNSALPQAPQVPQLRHECVACSETFLKTQLLTGSCSHRYCHECLEHLLKNTLLDESLFPPKCCRRKLPIESARALISAETWTRYEEKKIENKDRSRTYCCDPQCSTYILPTQPRAQNATCKKCTKKTCTVCKTMAHTGKCPQTDQAILSMAKDNGWQRCPNCAHLVELRSGCNHITCRCGFEYCYVCAAKWKSCGCDTWDERMLLEVQNACAHAGPFDKIGRAGACEQCDRWMPYYLFDCRECGFLTCRPCKSMFKQAR